MNVSLPLNEYFPLEIIIEILEYLDLKSLIRLELVNSFFLNIIRNFKWQNHIISLRKNHYIDHVIKTYQFQKFDFSYSNITNDSVKHLRKCHTLYLAKCPKVTSECINNLRNCNVYVII